MNQDFLLKISKQIWSDNFSDKPFPGKIEFGKGWDHQIVLLGKENAWDVLMRFGITRDISDEQKLLNYLISQNPPINLAKPIAIAKTSYNPPFDKCLIQLPINGEPLYKFFEHASSEGKITVGKKIANFVTWVNNLSKEMFDKEDSLKRVFNMDKEINTEKLKRYGLHADQISTLFNQIEFNFSNTKELLPCHGDLYPHHIFVDEDLNIGVIDWGDAALSEPYKDFRFWYEPFEGRKVYKEMYPDAFTSACHEYRDGFPIEGEERRLKLYALAGVLSYEDIDDLSHIDDWMKTYRNEFL